MNQHNMNDESRDAQRMANESLVWFGIIAARDRHRSHRAKQCETLSCHD